MTPPTREEMRAKLLANRSIEDRGYKTRCWIWTRSTNAPGYGRIWDARSKRTYSAHRVAAVVWLGFDLSSNLLVLHHCDQPSCINPQHLFVGTPLDNMRDMIAKGRQNFPGGGKGEAHGRSKLTETDVRRIRELLATGLYQYEIAAMFNVTPPLISMISLGKIWTHV